MDPANMNVQRICRHAGIVMLASGAGNVLAAIALTIAAAGSPPSHGTAAIAAALVLFIVWTMVAGLLAGAILACLLEPGYRWLGFAQRRWLAALCAVVFWFGFGATAIATILAVGAFNGEAGVVYLVIFALPSWIGGLIGNAIGPFIGNRSSNHIDEQNPLGIWVETRF